MSRRALSAKRNGRLGGLKTASTHSPEFLEQRAAKAGLSTRDTYGLEFYQHIRGLTKRKKSIKKLVKENVALLTSNVSNSTLMQQAVQSIN